MDDSPTRPRYWRAMTAPAAEHYHVYVARPLAAAKRRRRYVRVAGTDYWRRVEVNAPARRLGARSYTTTQALRFETKSAAHAAAARLEPRKAYRVVMRCDVEPADCPSKDGELAAWRRSAR